MSFAEGYYTKMLELQEKLRRSEEERLKLEEKFNEIMRFSRDAEHERLRILRHKYHKFLEEDRIRQDRNEDILRALDRIESKAKTFAAKTNRFKILRNQYQVYTRRIYATKKPQSNVEESNYQHAQSPASQLYTNTRKQLFSDLPVPERSETKIARLEQYLQDNFNNFPSNRSPKHRENVLNENRLFNEQNNFLPGYSLPEEHSQNADDIMPNYSQPEIVMDKESNYRQNYKQENGFFPHNNDSPTAQKKIDFMEKFPGNDTELFKEAEKSQLLGNTIEKELARYCEKGSAKQLLDPKSESNDSKDRTSDPYIQNYKDMVAESAKKLRLPNGVGSPKRMPHQIIEKCDEDKLNLSILNTSKNSDNIIPNIIVPVSSQEEAKNIVEIKNKKLVEQEENHSNTKEKINLETQNESSKTPKETFLNEGKSKEELLSEQEIIQKFSPESKTKEEVEPILEKLEVFEQVDDLTSKTPEVNSGRTEPPDDITLTTPSPIHLPLDNQRNPELPAAEIKQLPVHIKQSDSTSQQVSNPKDIQNTQDISNLSPQNTNKEQNQPLSDDISVIDEQKLLDNQNHSEKQETLQKLEDIKNYQDQEPHEDFPIETEVPQPEHQEVIPVHDNQVYPDPKQYVEEQEIYQPQEKYDPENRPVADEGLYPADQIQYATDEQQHAINPQYPVDQQHYPVDQEYAADEQKYNADEQQYATDEQNLSRNQEQYSADGQQLPANQQQYPASQQPYIEDQQPYSTDQQSYPIDQQSYPIDQQHYPADQQQYSEDQQQYLEDQQPYPADQQPYPADQQPYPADQQPYPADQQQYNEDQQQYFADQQPYSADQQQYPADQQQYPADQQQYPVEQQQYPADQQQYPADQQEYPADQQEYQEEYPQYPQNYGTDQSYPEGEYDPQQYPEGYSQEVYRSEQEYLQGEQNLDIQYQSEVTDQEYHEQYPTQEGISDLTHQREEPVPSEQSLNESIPLEKTNELNVSETTQKVAAQDIVQPDGKPLVEKQLPNLADMLDTDTESTKQETKVSNESDFDFSNT